MKEINLWWEDNNIFIEYENGETWSYNYIASDVTVNYGSNSIESDIVSICTLEKIIK